MCKLYNQIVIQINVVKSQTEWSKLNLLCSSHFTMCKVQHCTMILKVTLKCKCHYTVIAFNRCRRINWIFDNQSCLMKNFTCGSGSRQFKLKIFPNLYITLKMHFIRYLRPIWKGWVYPKLYYKIKKNFNAYIYCKD